ncbi:MAG: NeuD/PglB/VioB family sugar acetyltransferase [Candidatus Omnitrophota bacterium]
MAVQNKIVNVVLIGGGGHARVLWDILARDTAYHVLGYADMAATPGISLDYLGKDEDVLTNFLPGDVCLVNGVGSVHLPLKRQAVFEFFKKKGYSFCRAVHPAAIISSQVVLGEGVQIAAGAVIGAGARLGDNVIINTAASVDHDTIVGQHSHVAPGVTISGGVVIGQGVHVGAGATIVQGVCLGDGVLVAAGAVVIRDVPARCRIQGVPGKIYEIKR